MSFVVIPLELLENTTGICGANGLFMQASFVIFE
jgi:hypothetical protein